MQTKPSAKEEKSMKWLKKLGVLLTLVVVLLSSFTLDAAAVSSSKKYKTGYTKGYVIKTEKGTTGSGRRRWTYTKSKDVYVSERVILDKFVEYDGKAWYSTDDVEKLSVTKSHTVSASGSTDIIKALKLSVSLSVSKSSSVTYKVNPKKGDLCRLALKADFVEITYTHYTYNSSGKQTGQSTKTVLVPIPDTATYYIAYTN